MVYIPRWSITGALYVLSQLSQNHDYCPIGETIRPSDFQRDNSSVEFIVNDPSYRALSVDKLSGAIQHPTVTFDGDTLETINGTQFVKFHEFLRGEFPLTHETLSLEKINTYGLLYTWEGSDPSLKPLLLMAHQDVVPVGEETRGDWIYDPFSGFFDGENIWGRGSSDTKTMVIGQLQAVERLIQEGFKPSRTILLAYGFDEEIGGKMGAAFISEHLYERYGANGLYSLLDEGGTAMAVVGGTPIAQPAVGEKGVVNIKISLTTPGGHSSVPPDHTNIGIVSKLVSLIEDTPFRQIMDEHNPAFKYLQCIAQHTDEFTPEFKQKVFRSTWDPSAKKDVLDYADTVKELKYLVRTSQAVDIIHGGIKTNSLPELVTIDINHRISIESSVNETVHKIVDNVLSIANKFSLGLYHDNEALLEPTSNGYFNVTAPVSLEPARISPSSNEQWRIFAGSVKHIMEDYIYPNITRPSVVAPSITTGNTDTSHYWGLTENIYRYRLSTMHGVLEGHTHSVNEHTTIQNHLFLVAFNYEYIKSVDEYAKA
ncbi:M20 family metallopeptidase [Cyberlindnera jadinii NRRL Y-1542]|uniref:Carboxypeptidase S n=1 Tax=Cyberlindnera jadinii (strain ATCC 18201 / CBS 1600 / BCRC 20928 / JCM 3617 / NBRC 0987 / NRRL Y-1542) TaxID=983966 RepID=A0A1E4S2X8_CYBJN|nr:carboxypeptidase S [Cyberlindnera jadinii NRRL Y-1542]ODV73858.1 carboxypeptidase S [Cyberlindnera jadinii NRRL Y-1542]